MDWLNLFFPSADVLKVTVSVASLKKQLLASLFLP